MRNNRKMTLMTGLALTAALAFCGLLLTGCDSDSVAPQDELPALTESGAATQTALTAMAMASVGPELVRFDGLNKDAYSYTFIDVDGITGTVSLEYWSGSIGGDPATFHEGDYAHLWTPDDPGLVMEVDTGGSVSLTFDIEAEVVQATDTATILVGSSGTFTSGDLVSTFSFSDLVVTTSDYPSSGSMTFLGGGFEMVVTFDGDNTAVISVSGVDTWTVNLDDGTRTDI